MTSTGEESCSGFFKRVPVVINSSICRSEEAKDDNNIR